MESIWEDADEIVTPVSTEVSNAKKNLNVDCSHADAGEEMQTFSEEIVVENPYSPLLNIATTSSLGVRRDGDIPRPQRGRGVRSRRGRAGGQQQIPQPNRNSTQEGGDKVSAPMPNRLEVGRKQGKTTTQAMSKGESSKGASGKSGATKQATGGSRQEAKKPNAPTSQKSNVAQSAPSTSSKAGNDRPRNDQNKMSDRATESREKGRAIKSSLAKKENARHDRRI